MSVIQKQVRFEGSRGGAVLPALFDRGATYSCMREDVARALELLTPLPRPLRFGTADKKGTLTATHRVTVDFHLNNDRFSDEFMVIAGLSEPVIIGAKTLQSWRMKLDFERDEIIYDPKVTKLRIVACA